MTRLRFVRASPHSVQRRGSSESGYALLWLIIRTTDHIEESMTV